MRSIDKLLDVKHIVVKFEAGGLVFVHITVIRRRKNGDDPGNTTCSIDHLHFVTIKLRL